MVKIIETPRDAMQGINSFIPTKKKIELLNLLLKVGFDVIDFGSFVSKKAIPQLSDTAEVVSKIDLSDTRSKLLAIVANKRGAKEASGFDQIQFLGYPHSISEKFLQLNINSNLKKSRDLIRALQDEAMKKKKHLMVYLSMAFGNPYNLPWQLDDLVSECEFLKETEVRYVSLSDTIGAAEPEQMGQVFGRLNQQFPEIEFGLHLHTAKRCWYHLVDQAYKNGCRSFDGGIGGLGGCPLSGYELVENLKTRYLVWYLEKNDIPHSINKNLFEQAEEKANRVFSIQNFDKF